MNITVGLTVGRHMHQNWIFVMLLDAKGKYTGGGNILKATKDKLQIIETVNGAKLNHVNLKSIREPLWMVPLLRHDDLCLILKNHDMKVVSVPNKVLNIVMENKLETIDTKKLNNLESYKKLRPFQKEAVKFAISRGGKCLNGGEMGTGKTAMAICVLEYYSHLQPQLIVCPSSLKHNWKSEISKFSGQDVSIVKNGNSEFSNTSIISYSLLNSKKIQPKLRKFKLIILDESHYIKSANAQRTKLILKLTKIADVVLLLTGTPSSKSMDLFTQLKAIDHEHFTSFFPYKGRAIKEQFYFAYRYCNPTKVFLGRNRFGFKFDGNEREWELHCVLNKYMTRVTKSEVLHELPPKTRERIVIEQTSESRKKKFAEDFKKVDSIRETKGSRQADFMLMELVRETATLKLTTIINYVKYLIDKGNDGIKYLIFAHHRIILDAVVELMKKQNQNFITIDGRTKTDKRQNLVDSFQNDSSGVKFAVLSIKAAGVGLNLFKANVVVFCELLWSDKDMIQAEDRCHRSGLEHPVCIQYLIMEGTTDDIIWRTLCAKVKSCGAVLDNKRTFLNSEQVEYSTSKKPRIN